MKDVLKKTVFRLNGYLASLVMFDDAEQLISAFDNVEALKLIEIIFFRCINNSKKNVAA